MSTSPKHDRVVRPIDRAARYATGGYVEWTNKIYGTKHGMASAIVMLKANGIDPAAAEWGAYQQIVVPWPHLWPVVDTAGVMESSYDKWPEDARMTREALEQQSNSQRPDPEGKKSAPANRFRLLVEAEQCAFANAIPKVIQVGVSESGALELELGWLMGNDGRATKLVVSMLCPKGG